MEKGRRGFTFEEQLYSAIIGQTKLRACLLLKLQNLEAKQNPTNRKKGVISTTTRFNNICIGKEEMKWKPDVAKIIKFRNCTAHSHSLQVLLQSF